MDVEVDRNGNMWAWWMPPGWTGDPTRRVRDRLTSGLGSRRRRVRRAAGRGVGIRGDRHRCASAAWCPHSRGGRRILRRGGRAVRRRVRRIAAVDRRFERRSGARTARHRRNYAGRGTCSSRSQSRAPRRGPAPGRSRRGIRRIARGAGPCAGPGGRSRRGRRQRSGHTGGGSSRSAAKPTTPGRRGWSTGAIRCSPSRPRCTRRGRRPPHTTRSRRSARSSSRPTGPTRFRRRSAPGWTPGRADEATLTVAGRQDHCGGAAARRTRLRQPRRHRRIDHADSRVPGGAARTTDEGAGAISATSRCSRPRRGTTQASCPPVVPTAMLFVRNPTGVSHSPEGARRDGRLQSGCSGACRRHGRLDVPMTSATDWWCEHAWLGGDTVDTGVLITVADGRITSIGTNAAPQPRSNRLYGTGDSGHGQRAFARLPPGAARRAPNAIGDRSGPGAT